MAQRGMLTPSRVWLAEVNHPVLVLALLLLRHRAAELLSTTRATRRFPTVLPFPRTIANTVQQSFTKGLASTVTMPDADGKCVVLVRTSMPFAGSVPRGKLMSLLGRMHATLVRFVSRHPASTCRGTSSVRTAGSSQRAIHSPQNRIFWPCMSRSSILCVTRFHTSWDPTPYRMSLVFRRRADGHRSHAFLRMAEWTATAATTKDTVTWTGHCQLGKLGFSNYGTGRGTRVVSSEVMNVLMA